MPENAFQWRRRLSLTFDLLNELRQRWERVGAPIIKSLRPGLADAEIDRLTAPLGIQAVGEARVWWRWADIDGKVAGDFNMTGTGWEFLRLSKAAELAEWWRKEDAVHRREWERVVKDRPYRPLWRHSFLPVCVRGSGSAVVDCERPTVVERPVYYMDPHDMRNADDPPRTESLGEMIARWIDAFDSGAYFYDESTRRLMFDSERLRDPFDRLL